MIQVKQFAGILNTDDQPDVIPFQHHMDARNIVFRGNGQYMRAQNVPGNVIIPNDSLPEGTNVCIGAWYDQVKSRIFSFIYNSEGSHSIYQYSLNALDPFSVLVQCGINTDGDVLKFDIQQPILNVNIIYGDSTQGDILYWINSQKKPCKLNISRGPNGGYLPLLESYMDVAKEPASIPPYVVYEDDATISVNNLRKRLFKFKVRFVFDDDEKSVTSAQSEIPVPYNPFNTDVDTDPTKNSRIAVVFQTGPANVKKIELLAAVSTGNQFSDFFLVSSIDKAVEGLNDDDITVFNFYNDQAYNYIDLEESIQLFDYVPLQAVAQETLNGNVLIYGNITEGYPNLTDFAGSNVAFQADTYYAGRYFSLLVSNQSGDSGFGTGPIHVMVKGRVTQGNIYIITTTDATSISYTAAPGDGITEVLQGLIDDAVLDGYTVTGSTATPNEIYFTQTGKVLALSRLVVNEVSENTDNGNNGSLMAYDWWSRYAFGLVYFDQKGRTNGVVYPQNVFSGQTIGYEEISTVANIPEMLGEIYHTPPDWAYYYSWVRTKNTTKSTFVQWISDRTFKDTSASIGEQEYAYVSIESLNAFKTANPSTPLGYSFLPNDRIRFIKLFNPDNTTNEIYTDKDFEIQASVIDPVINGVQQDGQFIKIFLPTVDVSFDFGGEDYAYYFIELYTPAQSVAGGLDVYYEFGERYAIGDPTLPTRFHQGQTQNQNGLSPAVFFFTKGDDWTRLRRIQTGVVLNYSIPATNCTSGNAGRITMGIDFVSASFDDPNVLTGNSPCQDLVGFNISTNDDRWIIKIVTGSFTFRIVGTVTIVFTDSLPGDSYEFFLEKNDGTRYSLVAPFDASAAGTYTKSFDTTFTLDSGERIFFFGWSVTENDHNRTFQASSFTVTRTVAFTQQMIDPNFSDYYPSAVNSNGRAFVYDENADTVRYPVLMRWGLSYEPGTNINRTNRFYAQNMDEIDRGKGDIQRFKSRDRIMRIFQKRGCGQVGVYTKFIQDNTGQNTLTTTDEIITRNNIQYYSGEYGVGDHPESLVSGTIQDYFVDPIRGYQIRLSNDGITPISEIYKGQFYIRSLLVQYNQIWGRPDGSLAKILGVYDYENEEYIAILQSGQQTIGEEIITLDPYTFAFSEMRNAYCSFRDYHPEWMVCAEDVMYGWLNGEMYIHNSQTYCNFFGVQYDAYITVPFNENLLEKKTWLSVSEIANTVWHCPEIYTNVTSYGTQRQESTLLPAEFRLLENMPSASFKRDINSQGGKINGSALKGNWLVVKFQKTNASELVYLSAVNVQYIDSPLTPKK